MLASLSATSARMRSRTSWAADRCCRSSPYRSGTRWPCARLRRASGSSVSAYPSASRRPTSQPARSSTSTTWRANTYLMSRTTMSDRSITPSPGSARPRLGTLPAMRGYLRGDGRLGIRNTVLVAYLVECAHHVARRIVEPHQDEGAQLIGFPGCYPSGYAHRILEAMCTHPNTHSVLLISLGCEEFRRSDLLHMIRTSGRPAELLVIQAEGGTKATIAHGRAWVESRLAEASAAETRPIDFADLII